MFCNMMENQAKDGKRFCATRLFHTKSSWVHSELAQQNASAKMPLGLGSRKGKVSACGLNTYILFKDWLLRPCFVLYAYYVCVIYNAQPISQLCHLLVTWANRCDCHRICEGRQQPCFHQAIMPYLASIISGRASALFWSSRICCFLGSKIRDWPMLNSDPVPNSQIHVSSVQSQGSASAFRPSSPFSFFALPPCTSRLDCFGMIDVPTCVCTLHGAIWLWALPFLSFLYVHDVYFSMTSGLARTLELRKGKRYSSLKNPGSKGKSLWNWSHMQY